MKKDELFFYIEYGNNKQIEKAFSEYLTDNTYEKGLDRMRKEVLRRLKNGSNS